MSLAADSCDQVMAPNAEEREFLQYVRKVTAEKIAMRAEESSIKPMNSLRRTWRC
jgi:hypothetical protein